MVRLTRSIAIFNWFANKCWLAIVFCFAASWTSGSWAEEPSGLPIYELPWPSSESGRNAVTHLHPGALFFERTNQPLMRRDLPIRGAQSCAAAGCHGGLRPGLTDPTAERGSEYPLWFENDPHARSWRTICSPQSVAIMQRLRIIDGTTIRDRAGFDNCLACHNTAGHYGDGRVLSPLREGVGCAACHGPEGGWLERHYQRDWYPALESANGFVAAGDLFVRARMCASCHIGDADRDMNHDIIAAGHPPLRYEFATYHARLPKHWRDIEACDVSRFEAQLWLAGQMAALDASLTLLEARSGKLHSVSTWPELAEYDCASCHHQLRLRDIDRPGPRSRGLPRYANWNRAGLEFLLEHLERTGSVDPAATQLREAIRGVEAIMQSTFRPDPAATATAARGARQALDAWLRVTGLSMRSEFDVHQLVELAVGASRSAASTSNWESAVQFYLAAVAGRAGWPAGDEPRTSLKQLRSALGFPSDRAASSFPFDAEQGRPTRDQLQILVEAVGHSLTQASLELE